MKKALSVLVIGLTLGWIIGLSLSPVVYLVVTAVLALIGPAVSALAGLPTTDGTDKTDADSAKDKDHPADCGEKKKMQPAKLPNIDPLPLALFMIGLAGGAPIGIWARTQDWLGVRPEAITSRWQTTGLPSAEIAKRAFDQLYPPAAPKKDKNKTSSPKDENSGEQNENVPPVSGGNAMRGGLLSGFSEKDVKKLRDVKTAFQMREILKESFDKRLNKFEAACKDKNNDCLEAAVKYLILEAPSDKETAPQASQ